MYTEADLVFGFPENQILVDCPTCRSGGQLSSGWKTPLPVRQGRNSFRVFSKKLFCGVYKLFINYDDTFFYTIPD
jgi:hypothetical protein